MAIVVETMEQASMIEQIRLDRKLWLTEDKSKVVEDGDPEAAFLYGPEGHLVPKPEAEKLGALPQTEEQKSAAKQRKSTPPNKQADKPEDKQASESENK